MYVNISHIIKKYIELDISSTPEIYVVFTQ